MRACETFFLDKTLCCCSFLFIFLMIRSVWWKYPLLRTHFTKKNKNIASNEKYYNNNKWNWVFLATNIFPLFFFCFLIPKWTSSRLNLLDMRVCVKKRLQSDWNCEKKIVEIELNQLCKILCLCNYLFS